MKRGGLLSRLAELVFPKRCTSCGELLGRDRVSDALCKACYVKYLSEKSTPCPTCAREYNECICRPENFLPDKLCFSLPYDKTGGVIRKLLLSCKNSRNRAAFELITELMARDAEKAGFISKDALVTYVPRSPEKLSSTGVDQARELAIGFCARTGLRCISPIKHHPSTLEQKMLPKRLRLPNANSKFYLPHSEDGVIRGRDIILIDDIVTSGATASACTSLLKDRGARSVVCLAAAKSVKDNFDRV